LKGVFQLLGQQLRVHDIEVELDMPESPAAGVGRRQPLGAGVHQPGDERPGQPSRKSAWATAALQGICIQGERAHDGGKYQGHISDNGMGVPAICTEQCFEPFFTTKEVGKGTGLGLSISYGIVRDSGGAINVTSTPGRGASFCLSFPAALEDE
jgi:hypothetical protein